MHVDFKFLKFNLKCTKTLRTENIIAANEPFRASEMEPSQLILDIHDLFLQIKIH